jgi:hypothetical protein
MLETIPSGSEWSEALLFEEGNQQWKVVLRPNQM